MRQSIYGRPDTHDVNSDLENMLNNHPCYNEDAHTRSARMHLPVAPACNIQCNYCNRKFDCSNESRPGVTSEVLTPEQAVSKIAYVREKIPNLSVVGIAGPGDPLANETTFRTLDIVRQRFPDLAPCISTNGLALPDNAERLFALGVRFVTVTMNAPDAATGAMIYSRVNFGGKVYSGEEGADILISRQLEGIRLCAGLGMLVKVNIVMIPGVNADRIPELVKKVKSLGAYIVNILPLIPVPGTAFENLRGPTPAERKELMDRCSLDARMMRHCRQCRADAVGLLGEDRSGEFSGCGLGRGDGCGPSEDVRIVVPTDPRKHRIALASSDSRTVDSGFGNAVRFMVYDADCSDVSFVRRIDIPAAAETVGAGHRRRLADIADLLGDCDIVAVSEIGDLPRSILEERGKRVAVVSGDIRGAVAGIVRERFPDLGFLC